jgi:class 3 adenylate cyclase
LRGLGEKCSVLAPFMSTATPSSLGPGQRSLAAIVFTDVVSFSARMQADEETTLTLLKRDFDAMRQICGGHQGSVLKTTRDRRLRYFSRAAQAMRRTRPKHPGK